MFKNILIILVLVLLIFPDVSQARRRRRTARVSPWVASVGGGMTVDPGLALLNFRLEYQQSADLFIGPLVQLGLGSILFTGSAAARYRFLRRGHISANVETGAGLSFANGVGTGDIGLHLFFGLGADYFLSKTMSVGTAIRTNFAFGVDDFFLSIPLAILRLRI